MGDTRFKRGDRVSVVLADASVLNSIVDENGDVIGLRVTDRKRPSFWSVVPVYAVKLRKKRRPQRKK